MGKRNKHEALDLTIKETPSGYQLFLGDTGLKTDIGRHPIQHPSQDFLHHVIQELMQVPAIDIEGDLLLDLPVLTSHRLLGIQREFVENARDNLSENFSGEILRDKVLERTAGPEENDRYARFASVVKWLAGENLRIVDLDFVDLEELEVSLPGYMRINGNMGDEHTSDFRELAAFLKSTFESLSAEERTAVVMLHNLHRGAVIHALALLTGNCTSIEYSLGVGAAHHVISVYGEVSDVEHTGAYQELKRDADVVLGYVDAFRRGTLVGLIRTYCDQGETGEVEYKSTLRYNLREGKKDRAMTNVVVKTVAGFLNTNGGTLLIGVDDSGKVLGLTADGFENRDAFLLHLYTSLSNSLGVHTASLVDADIDAVDGNDVCLVSCRPSESEVLCTFKGQQPKLFVRAGPQTVPVEGEEREEYIRKRWS